MMTMITTIMWGTVSGTPGHTSSLVHSVRDTGTHLQPRAQCPGHRDTPPACAQFQSNPFCSFRGDAPQTDRQTDKLKGEFNLDIMSQSGYWSYISVNNFHPLVVAFCTLVKKL